MRASTNRAAGRPSATAGTVFWVTARKTLSGDELRSVEAAEVAKEDLRNLKAGSRSLSNPAGQQPGAAVGVSKVQQAAAEAVESETPQQQERKELGTEL